ncbi:hypothetical protein B0I18_105128 [Taibaiella chishuiensis]|uniref:Uncharacterized protein n=1 Tax=Taibaiella chishuiensis TaxID=1434707 RepID=A0A2P8D2W9_9BACT|nr:hypothetical protein B0I18_105128 [Taibaiella chishuiensis]
MLFTLPAGLSTGILYYPGREGNGNSYRVCGFVKTGPQFIARITKKNPVKTKPILISGFKTPIL